MVENFVIVNGKMITACNFCPDGEKCKKVRVLCSVYMNFKAKEARVDG